MSSFAIANMDAFLSIASGGVAGGVIVWLLRGWISERLKQSIQHEYSQKLETYKAELNTRIQAIQHENQLNQLRTSLFFDHQRNAFSEILTKIAEVNNGWKNEGWEPYVGIIKPVPSEQYDQLLKLYYQHQLFLDSACLAAMELVLEFYVDSFPEEDEGGQAHGRKADAAFEGVEYLYPRLAALFQQRIGVSRDNSSRSDIALLGGIRLINRYHFKDIGLPVKGALQLGSDDRPADAVTRAMTNQAELVSKLDELYEYLGNRHGVFHEARTQSKRYVDMLRLSGQ